jgi:hypothetical protein
MKIHQIYTGDFVLFEKSVLPEFKEELKGITLHPNTEHKLWLDSDIRNLIFSEYGDRGIAVYEKIRPNTFKCDFARAVILNSIGGLYLDIGYEILDLDSVLELTKGNDMILFYDIEDSWFVNYAKYDKSIQSAVMYSKGKNSYLTQLIEELMENVESNFYGDSPWDALSVVRFGKVFEKANPSFRYALGNCKIDDNNRKMFSIPKLERPLAAGYRQKKISFFHKPGNCYVGLWEDGKLYNF